jgi:hypothetical protein
LLQRRYAAGKRRDLPPEAGRGPRFEQIGCVAHQSRQGLAPLVIRHRLEISRCERDCLGKR